MMHEWMISGWVNECMHGWMGGWMGGVMGGLTCGWMDSGKIRKVFLFHVEDKYAQPDHK